MALAIKKRTVVILVFHLVLLIVAGLLFNHFWSTRDNQAYVRQRMNANQALDFSLTFEEVAQKNALAFLTRIDSKELTLAGPAEENLFSLSTDAVPTELVPEDAVLTEVFVCAIDDRGLGLNLNYKWNGGTYGIHYSLDNRIIKEVASADQAPSNVESFIIRNDSTLVEYWSH